MIDRTAATPVHTILTVTQVNQNFSLAKQAVAVGPVTITERGEPSLVLLQHSEFKRLQQAANASKSEVIKTPLWQLAQQFGVEDIEFELPERAVEPFPRLNQGIDELDN
jgi:prevent-host-death family protein